MKVVLLADVKGQGKKDQVVEVSDGYARNYLIPHKLAAEADAKILNDIKNKEAAQARKIELEKQEAKALAEKLANFTIKIKVQAGSNGKMYGSVTTKDIAEAVKNQQGIEIDKRKIDLSEAIRNYGAYQIGIKLYAEITGKINLVVSDS